MSRIRVRPEVSRVRPVNIRTPAHSWRAVTVAAACTALLSALVCAAPPRAMAVGHGFTEVQPANVPYKLPVVLPSAVHSPAQDAQAPYTRTVVGLIKQLLPSDHPTLGQLQNALRILDGTDSYKYSGGHSPVASCNQTGSNLAPSGTTPAISPLCWTDGAGVELFAGPQRGRSTAATQNSAVAGSFDPRLGNAWGQVQGAEARAHMATGLLGPQVDTDIFPNWARSSDETGEDPYLGGETAASEVNGIQGRNTMAQTKHVLGYYGNDISQPAQIADQALHELFAPPYESAGKKGSTASYMCSYQKVQVPDAPNATLGQLTQRSPFGSTTARTRNLSDPNFACGNPLIEDQLIRGEWNSKAFVGTDYPVATRGTDLAQGTEQNMPGGDPRTGTKSVWDQIPQLVRDGRIALPVFEQALARVLYQEERFGLLGCNDSSASCGNPGGVNGVRDGSAALPTGSPGSDAVIGTEHGDAAVAEKSAEEGAVLLKNDASTLPITPADLSSGVALSGPLAEYNVGSPNNEASGGYPDRSVISTLQQIKTFARDKSAFTYSPAQSPSGYAIPSSALSTSTSHVTGGLHRTGGPGAPETDRSLDFTTASPDGPLGRGDYAWSGYLYVPSADTYTLRTQSTEGSDIGVGLSVDGKAQKASTPASVYTGPRPGMFPMDMSTTRAGFTAGGLDNSAYEVGRLSAGYHSISVSFSNAGSAKADFRLAYSRADGDISDAAAAAKGKSKAIVFVGAGNTGQLTDPADPDMVPEELPAGQVALIKAVAAANPNTSVVLNTSGPVITASWIHDVRSVLDMWQPGQEGGTATARLLLGLANPSGRTVTTWPQGSKDTLFGNDQNQGLFPGDATGTHPERVGGTAKPTGQVPVCETDTVCQGEDAKLNGPAIAVDHRNYTGSGFASGFLGDNDSLRYQVSPGTAGTYRLKVRYANATGSKRSLRVAVDTGPARLLALPDTGGTDNWSTAQVSLRLGAGPHTVRLFRSGSDSTSGDVDVDSLGLTAPGAHFPTAANSLGGLFECSAAVTCELERGHISGTGLGTATDHAGYSGEGFVAGFTREGDRAQVNLPSDAGDYTLQLRYGNATGSAQKLTVDIDGKARHISLPALSDWNTWSVRTVGVSLTAGIHRISILRGSEDSGNVNIDSIALTADGARYPARQAASFGIYAGYRYYDQLGMAVQFPFGWGLSYTDFAYSAPAVTATNDGGLKVTYTIRNTGSQAGSAVAQVYLGPPSERPNGVEFAPRALAGFDHVSIAAGASRTVTTHVDPRALQYWSTSGQRWTRTHGARDVFVGPADSPHQLRHATTP
ncbi:glycoside hydrolase family 3 C-terminal domain-containing protein [Streptomyces sp. NBC_00859]|uniref:glycoside hydrolase family 3 C-terminal domain-containing protein n=1 Tax=Streptomyces sp. NBC_00859 TaxID=2903682 RepID=UPI00386B2419|nr:glycoside hydrolase family 3 C-terminal domain-containing protein [Streptomyces sp. NBC_00859]